MSLTNINDVNEQVQKYWAPLFVPELKESTLLPSLVNKEYQGQIKRGGDQVRVSQIITPEAEMKTIGTDADYNTFSASKMQTRKVDVVADKIITAAVEIDDIVDLQSQIGDQDSEIRRNMIKAVELKINEYLYSLVAPSDSNPDHTITGVADFNASQLADIRKKAAMAHWGRMKPWYALLDPSYYSDFLNAQTMVSNDYGASDEPLIGGQFAKKRHGFFVLEDDSKVTDTGLFFHPDFMYLVMQEMPNFKVSDLHSNKQHGYLVSVKLVIGAKIGIQGDVKHITVTA